MIVWGVSKTESSKAIVLVPPAESACWTAHRSVPVAGTPPVTVSSVLVTVNVDKSWRSSSWTSSGFRRYRGRSRPAAPSGLDRVATNPAPA